VTSIRVLDTDFETVAANHYDLCVFASGYESRCTAVPRGIKRENVANPAVFGFTEASQGINRAQNDAWFLEEWKCTPVALSGDDEKPIYDYLHACSQSLSTIRILVDYSSMSRLWYTAVLNWARFAASGRAVIIDFVYALGRYAAEEQPFVVRDMLSLPGCEGRAYRLRESVAVFGLGFHGLATLCVLDHLEPDTVYAFFAFPGASSEYEEKTREANRAILSAHKTRAVLELPLPSVESAYRSLAETIAPHRPDGEITLVPMGPKPHVLASILVAMRFPEVACLRVTAMSKGVDVEATSSRVVTRVIIKADTRESLPTAPPPTAVT
jgi:hypothetical protein